MLILSFYAISPHTPSLIPVRIPNDQNTRWRLTFHISTNKRQEFLISLYLSDIHLREWKIFVTPHTCDNDNFDGACHNPFFGYSLNSLFLFHNIIYIYIYIYIYIQTKNKKKSKKKIVRRGC